MFSGIGLYFIGPASALSSIILAIISFLSGLGWMLDRKKYRQEVEGIKADNRQKDLDLGTEFAQKFKELIGQPLEEEVEKLRNEVKELRDAIEAIYDCAYRGNCPVRKRMQRKPQDS